MGYEVRLTRAQLLCIFSFFSFTRYASVTVSSIV